MKLSEILSQRHSSRLFPLVADTQLENRAVSIFLSVFERVFEFRQDLMQSIGKRVGPRAKIDTYTEIPFTEETELEHNRPDGLIVMTIGSNQWRALLEAKVGNAEMNSKQIEDYL